MDINQFNAAKEKARKLIHDDAKKDAHIIKERTADRANFLNKAKTDGPAAITGFEGLSPSYSNGSASMSMPDDDNNRLYEAMDRQMSQYQASRNIQPQMPVQSTQQNFSNSKLPKEILESFKSNYIDQSAFNPNKSVLDTPGIINETVSYDEPVMNKQSVQEQGSSKIDYELIKSIVESAVKKYVGAYTKKMLTENKENTIQAVRFNGEKFAFITKNGDLYEAKLTYKSNIKDKK